MKKSTKKFGLLIVDDEPRIRKIYKDALQAHFLLGPSWNSIADFEDGESALKYIKEYKDKKEYHLIVVADAYMGPNCENNKIKDANKLFGGVWLIDQVNKNDELKGFVTILLITFYDEKIKSYRMGNDVFKWVEEKDYYYVEKPRANTRIKNQIEATEALSKIEDSEEIKKLFEKTFYIIEEITKDKVNEDAKECNDNHGIIGKSQAIIKCIQISEKSAESDANVLLRGETGTGKELFARLICDKSKRSKMPFLPIPCPALSEALFESELFGHVKGAFTGALTSREGRFKEADNGTIFFDEIADLPLCLQPKILRVVQEGEFQVVGSNKTVNVDVRIIAATHENLEELVANGKFREDLYYRLSVIPIILPPLRERKEDIPLLVKHFLEEFNYKNSKKCNITSEALKLLSGYSWTGNVRELQNFVERLVVLSDSDAISEKEVEEALASKSNVSSKRKLNFYDGLRFETLHKEYIHYILEKTRRSDGTFNRAAAGKLSGAGLGDDAIKTNIEKYAKTDPSFSKYIT